MFILVLVLVVVLVSVASPIVAGAVLLLPGSVAVSLAIVQVRKIRDESGDPQDSTETIKHLRRILRLY